MKTRKDEDHIAYCKARNRVTKMTKNERRKFEESTAMNIKVNPKLAWKYIKSKYNVKEGIPELIKEPNAFILELTKSDKQKAGTLQSNFCSVFTKEPQGPFPDIENKHIEHKMHKIRIHEDEIEKNY